jgi:hypothetical protein
MKRALSFVLVAMMCFAMFAQDIFSYVPLTGSVKTSKQINYVISSKFGNYFRTPASKLICKYDDLGKELESVEMSEIDEIKTKTFSAYDDNGNLIEERYNPNNPRNEFVITYEYNEFSQKIYENQYTYEAWYSYNSKGLLETCTVNKFDSSEDEGDEIYEYDENGNLIHFKNWDVNLEFEYEFFPNGNIKRKITRKVE